MRESLQRAFAYLAAQKVKIGISQQVDTTDFHVEGIDLLSNHVPCEAGIALIVAMYSAIKKQSVLPGLVILGDLSIQGNIKSLRSLVEPLQSGMDNGARRALVPLENKRNFLEVSGDIVERVDPIFFSDPLTAAIKALEALKRPCSIRLATDSKYLMLGITEWLKNWKVRNWKTSQNTPVKNDDLWKKLDHLNSRHKVQWLWVRGHIGHPENELADQLARKALKDLLSENKNHKP